MHEDRLPRSTGGKIRDRGLGFHVLHRVHADAEMRQQRPGQHLAQFKINRRAAGRRAVAAAVAAECAEESAVARAGVHAVQTIDDVQALFEGLQCGDGFRQFRLRQGAAALHASRDAGRRIKPLILQEKDHPLWPTARAPCSRPADFRE